MCILCDPSVPANIVLRTLTIECKDIISVDLDITDIDIIVFLNCPKLENIINIPDIFMLSIMNCPILKKLPDILSNIVYLYCSETMIEKIPKLPNIQYLICNNCKELKEMEDYENVKNITMLMCYFCKKFYLPLEFHKLYRKGEAYVKHPMEIAIEKLDKNIHILQKKFIKKMYHPDSCYVKNTLTKRFYDKVSFMIK